MAQLWHRSGRIGVWFCVVHCVRVPLTSTTVAEFWACGSLVGIGLCTVTYLCVQYCGLLGAPLSLFSNGPTSWQCNQAYMCDLVRVHVIISFGDCSVSLLCPMYWAMPHCSVGGTTIVVGSLCHLGRCTISVSLSMTPLGVNLSHYNKSITRSMGRCAHFLQAISKG